MKKVLIAYYSREGNTEKMAEYIAEGVRFSGNQPTIKKVPAIKSAAEINGFDGYIFGSPTYFQAIPDVVKTFLFLCQKAELSGKLAGTFGSYSHEGNAPGMILDTMQHIFGMEVFELGAFKLMEHELAIFDRSQPAIQQTEGMRACQAYGKVFGEKLESAA